MTLSVFFGFDSVLLTNEIGIGIQSKRTRARTQRDNGLITDSYHMFY